MKISGYIVSNDDKEIYDYFGMEATSPNDVLSEIANAKGAAINVEINSPGGDVFAGNEIYTALRGYSGGVNISIVGLAASAASIIAMAGKSEISPVAMMMVHNVSSMAGGDYHDMDKASEMLQTANKALAGAYVAKSGMSEENALAMMNKETWLSAQDAVDKGLVDKVMFSDGQLVAAATSGMLPRSVIEKTRNMLHPPEPPENNEVLKAKLALQLTL